MTSLHPPTSKEKEASQIFLAQDEGVEHCTLAFKAQPDAYIRAVDSTSCGTKCSTNWPESDWTGNPPAYAESLWEEVLQYSTALDATGESSLLLLLQDGYQDQFRNLLFAVPLLIPLPVCMIPPSFTYPDMHLQIQLLASNNTHLSFAFLYLAYQPLNSARFPLFNQIQNLHRKPYSFVLNYTLVCTVSPSIHPVSNIHRGSRGVSFLAQYYCTIALSIGKMNRVETDMSPRPYDPYDSLVDFELSSIMTRAFNQQNLLPFSSAISQLQLYQCEDHSAGHPLLKLENLASDSLETIDPNGDHLPATAQLQLSDFELGPAWTSAHTFPQPLHNHIGQTADCGGLPIMPYTPDSLSGPQSSYQYYKEGDGRSPWSSSPEFAHCRPLASVEEGEEAFDDKPYARLIYEALMLAPGHRMMLRDLYEWFRLNTTKPQESGSNGWQNSIRHNLSMNKVCDTALATMTDLLTRRTGI